MAQPHLPQPHQALFSGGPANLPTSFGCNAERVVQAGGALSTKLLHPDIRPFSRTFRRAPSSGLYMATKNRPYQLTLGAFIVPPQTVLALQGAKFQPYRFDALAPGDGVPLEDRRLALSLGYDITLSTAERQGNIETQIIPGSPNILATPTYPNSTPSTVTFPAFPTVATRGDSPVGPLIPTAYGVVDPGFDATLIGQQSSAPGQFVLTVGAGGALMAQTEKSKQGPDDMPFTYFVNENQNVTLTAVAFAPVRIPISFLEGIITGYLLPKTTADALLQKMRPCG